MGALKKTKQGSPLTTFVHCVYILKSKIKDGWGLAPLEKSRCGRLKASDFSRHRSLTGFTLLEAIIYIALFTLVIGGGLIAAYQLIEGARQVEEKTIIEAEANFLKRKLDWALSGGVVDTPGVNAEGDTLVVDKEGTDYTFAVDADGIATLENTGAAVPLTNGRVVVSDLLFDHNDETMSGRPPVLEYSFKINDQWFATTTRYAR